MSAVGTLADFATAIWEPDDIVELRLLPSRNGRPIQRWQLAAKLSHSELSKHNADGFNIYAGANPRKCAGTARIKAKDCTRARPCGACERCVALARCLFVDFDDCDEAEARRRVEVAGLPLPTVIVASGHGVHYYWRLEAPVEDLAIWTVHQRALISILNSDRSVHDPPRIMRLPGFLNHKPPPADSYVIECEPERRYPLTLAMSVPGQLRKVCPLAPQRSVRKLRLLREARAHADAEPGTVEGERNCSAFKLAGKLRAFTYNGTDDRLGEDEIMELIRSWNRRCTPPLRDAELVVAVANSGKYTRNKPDDHVVQPDSDDDEAAGPAPPPTPPTLDAARSLLHKRLGLDVAKVLRLGGDRCQYDLVLDDGQRVQLGPIGAVLNPLRVQEALAEQLGLVIRLRTRAHHQPLAQALLALVEQLDGEDTEGDETRSWLRSSMGSWLSRTVALDEAEALYDAIEPQWGHHGVGFHASDDRLYLKVSDLVHHVCVVLGQRITAHEIRRRLVRLGFARARLQARKGAETRSGRYYASPVGFRVVEDGDVNPWDRAPAPSTCSHNEGPIS